MKCYVEVVTVPTADTPGTLLLLHFDNCRYLIGNISEGTQRASVERGVGLRKVSSILVSGRTEWWNLGGLLGLVLETADVKKTAHAATAKDVSETANTGTIAAVKKRERLEHESGLLKLDIYGTTNLNHMIATSRRFIFRNGMPLSAIEHGQIQERERTDKTSSEPVWKDERINVWTMALRPQGEESTLPLRSASPRKRSYDELVNDGARGAKPQTDQDPFLAMRQAVVGQMFNSSWKLDNLIPQPLSSVKLPAKIFTRNTETKQYEPYEGPLPGSGQELPDITVWVREPWPGALTETLPPVKPSQDALSYIIRNHPQRGKFLPQKAIELKVPKGWLWSQLSLGHTVQNELGEDITPAMVLESGKQGGGFAVVDLPTVAYIESLLARPEWANESILDGVEAIFWLCGPGVASDERVQRFQTSMTRMKHILASAEGPNYLSLDAAATNLLRQHYIDDTVFPSLQYASPQDQAENNSSQPPAPDVIIAQPGQVLMLEPRVELNTETVKVPLDVTPLQAKITEEFASLGIPPEIVSSTQPTVSNEEWASILPHGDAEIIILGTGSSHPSKCRNVSGTLVRVPGCGSYLLDCGEGTLGTLRRMFSPSDLTQILQDLKVIWISHLHADHHLGTASLVKAWSEATKNNTQMEDAGNKAPLAVISDAPMLHWLHEYGSAEDLGLDRVLTLGTQPSRGRQALNMEQGSALYHIPASNCPPGSEDKRSTEEFLDILNLKALNSVFVNHCMGAQAISMTFKSGLKISYSGDCRPSASFAVIGRNSDVLIHEATFQDDMRSEALAKKHSTAGEALIVAHEMKAKVCLLTHFSQRYPEMPKFGAQIRGRGGSPSVRGLSGVLEDADEAQPTASMSETNAGDNEKPAETNRSQSRDRSRVRGHTANTLGNNDLKRTSSGHLELIDSNDIKDMLSESGMKVIFGFDYMRLKLSSIPLLEAKQPLLRRMYDEGIGKDMEEKTSAEEVQAANDAVVAQRDAKKKAKADKMNMQKAVNEKRARSSENKWAQAAKRVTEGQ